MIRISDAFVLAYTKLRVHRVRTGIAIAVSGLLFGLIAAVIIVVQGVFSSVDRFSDEGLNNRTILNVTQSGGAITFNEYDKSADPTFVAEVEVAHKAIIDKKKAAALKYGVEYNAAAEDPSPIMIDPETKQKVVKDTSLSDKAVQDVANAKRLALYKPFDVKAYLKDYKSANIIQEHKPLQPSDGELVYMKDGKEPARSTDKFTQYDSSAPNLTVLNGSVSQPFITNTAFDPQKGEIPVIVPYGAAEKLLKLEALTSDASMQAKYDRLQEVRSRISEVTASFCYRNNASQGLLSQATMQQKEIRDEASNKDYVKPSLIYTVPNDTDCAGVGVATDTRTAAQKKQDAQKVLYEKEIGEYIGEPYQALVKLRGVGISSDVDGGGQWSVAELTKTLFASSIGYGTWVVPANLLEQVPAQSRPDAIFKSESNARQVQSVMYGYESYLVEFTDKNEARKLLTASNTSMLNGSGGEVYSMPFGSGILFVDELKNMFTNVLMWMFAIIGAVAIIILASIIGRTVSEGRRESSIFRAIGASRFDIGSIYGMYVLLLSLRVVLFAAILGMAIAATIEFLFWKDATLGASLSYAASDTAKEFHLFSLSSPYLLWMIGVIIISAVVASVIPILLGARRNPIKDMRNDA